MPRGIQGTITIRGGLSENVLGLSGEFELVSEL